MDDKKDTSSLSGSGKNVTAKNVGMTEIIPRSKNIYVRRQIPAEDYEIKELTPEQKEQINILDERLNKIAEKVMKAGRSEKETYEQFLEEVRSNLNSIIKIDPARYEAPLGNNLENAIIKIYTVLGR